MMGLNQGVTVPKIAKVLLPLPLDDVYDYYLPDDIQGQEGDIVLVPFQSREGIGVIWQILADQPSTDKKFRIKEISSVIAGYHIPEISRRFVDWVAGYTLNPRGQILKMVISSREALEGEAPKLGYRVNSDSELPNELQDERLLQAHSLADIMRVSGRTRHQIQKWIKAEVLLPDEMIDEALVNPEPDHMVGQFSPAQQHAIDHIRQMIATPEFSVALLDGVTGSGKTEVYFEGVAEALRRDKQVLVMLPEIALSPQTIARFKHRFGVEPAVWHSDLTLNQRKKTWRGVCHGQAKVVIGARSALFLPFPNLGLIVVDEEHEQSYKQEEGVIYQARDMAVVRAKLDHLPVVLVSATPSLETVVNWQQGKYTHLELPERYGIAELPTLELVDCRQRENVSSSFKWLSAPLVAALEHTLAQGDQTLLFLNRRGYAPLTLCRSCGHRIQCVQCSTWLVEHRHFAELRCHQCGYATPKPKACPQCHTPDHLVPCGPGVERLYEEVIQHFTSARVMVMASDMIQSPRHLKECIDKIHNQEVDIIIGTQMMAKGHHFEHLTLVGVVDADLGLSGGDLRASEKTYQLLHQVSGRAGRAGSPGRVLIQTYQPEHPVMQALVAQERDRFIEEESRMRLQSEMPPFARLAALIISSPFAEDAEKAARLLARVAPRAQEFQVMGPVPAPLTVIRGRHRWRLLLRSPKNLSQQPYLRQWLKAAQLPSSVRLHIDIDPYSFL